MTNLSFWARHLFGNPSTPAKTQPEPNTPGTVGYRLHVRARRLAEIERRRADSDYPEMLTALEERVVWQELDDLERVSYPTKPRKEIT